MKGRIRKNNFPLRGDLVKRNNRKDKKSVHL